VTASTIFYSGSIKQRLYEEETMICQQQLHRQPVKQMQQQEWLSPSSSLDEYSTMLLWHRHAF